MTDTPLLTILIATKDRPDDLDRTLQALKRVVSLSVELIVIDDGSQPPLESVVRENWPEAIYVREPVSAGCPQRRTEGFSLARGRYILELDDDSHPVTPDALIRAVNFLETHPETGLLAFYIYNGPDLPASLPRPRPRYTASFVGCGALFRTAALRETGGYRPFFQSEGEEQELCLRFLKAGWAIYFFPDVLIHHQVSPRCRNAARSWMRSFRNKLWSHLMHFPLRRLPLEMGWTLAVAAWDSIRLLRPHYFIRGLLQFLAGAPRALALRQPMSRHTCRLYDALRFRGIFTEEEFRNPPRCGWAEIWAWYRTAWRRRPRQRSVWDRTPGDTGTSPTVSFAHEYAAQPATQAPPPACRPPQSHV